MEKFFPCETAEAYYFNKVLLKRVYLHNTLGCPTVIPSEIYSFICFSFKSNLFLIPYIVNKPSPQWITKETELILKLFLSFSQWNLMYEPEPSRL